MNRGALDPIENEEAGADVEREKKKKQNEKKRRTNPKAANQEREKTTPDEKIRPSADRTSTRPRLAAGFHAPRLPPRSFRRPTPRPPTSCSATSVDDGPPTRVRGDRPVGEPGAGASVYDDDDDDDDTADGADADADEPLAPMVPMLAPCGRDTTGR
jgi:hypothetical protein